MLQETKSDNNLISPNQQTANEALPSAASISKEAEEVPDNAPGKKSSKSAQKRRRAAQASAAAAESKAEEEERRQQAIEEEAATVAAAEASLRDELVEITLLGDI